MSRKVRALILAVGIVVVLSWGFRFWVLWELRNVDPMIVGHTLFALINFGLGLFLLFAGTRPSILPRDARLITATGLFFLIYWLYRGATILINPSGDPNPRAHLHLSGLFIVVGALLCGVGLNYLKRPDRS